MRARALSTLKSAGSKDPRIDLVQIALQGGKNGFEKIIKMIDELVVVLGKEQKADDDKNQYCDAEFDKSEDKAKELKLDIETLKRQLKTMRKPLHTSKKKLKLLQKALRNW